jgi:hypothetical protein
VAVGLDRAGMETAHRQRLQPGSGAEHRDRRGARALQAVEHAELAEFVAAPARGLAAQVERAGEFQAEADRGDVVQRRQRFRVQGRQQRQPERGEHPAFHDDPRRCPRGHATPRRRSAQ